MMTKVLGPVAILALLMLASVTMLGCDTSASTKPASTRPSGAKTVSMALGKKTYSLEVAADDMSRELGLMNRDHMPADQGMIFVFPDSADRNFWMKNTLIPLDIVFIDAGGKVVSTHTMKPLDETTTPSDGEAKYAVELNAGEVAADGIKKGEPVTIPADAETAVK